MLSSNKKNRKSKLLPLILFTGLFPALSAQANMKAAEKWIDQEFQPSTLARQKQLDEILKGVGFPKIQEANDELNNAKKLDTKRMSLWATANCE